MGHHIFGNGFGNDEADVAQDCSAFEVGNGGVWDIKARDWWFFLFVHSGICLDGTLPVKRLVMPPSVKHEIESLTSLRPNIELRLQIHDLGIRNADQKQNIPSPEVLISSGKICANPHIFSGSIAEK